MRYDFFYINFHVDHKNFSSKPWPKEPRNKYAVQVHYMILQDKHHNVLISRSETFINRLRGIRFHSSTTNMGTYALSENKVNVNCNIGNPAGWGRTKISFELECQSDLIRLVTCDAPLPCYYHVTVIKLSDNSEFVLLEAFQYSSGGCSNIVVSICNLDRIPFWK